MSILYNRIRFTEMVDACMANNDLASAVQSVKSKREQLIKKMRENHEDATRRQLRNLSALFQEFTDVLKDLNGASDKKAVWEREMRFYPNDDGRVVCRCSGMEVLCSDSYGTSDMLVTTKLTREVRVKIMEAMLNNKVFVGKGKAGTGKTETCKDTLRMLGMEPMVYNCSDKPGDITNLINAWKDSAEKSGGKKCAIIFDEFNRLPKEDAIAHLKAFREIGAFICVTFNPWYAGRSEMVCQDEVPQIVQEFTIPEYSDIVRCMLAAEGVLECDELGVAICNLLDGCRNKMSKQQHYDFGLRGVRALVRALGYMNREANDWSNVKSNTAKSVAKYMSFMLTEEDRGVLFNLLKEFMTEVPQTQCNLADNLEFVLRIRHGAAVLGKHSAESVKKMTEELDQRMKAKSTSIGFGTVDESFGPNGTFVNALREASKAVGPFNIYVSGEFTVNPNAIWMEELNTVLDDNKCLNMKSAERIQFGDNVRIVFFIENVATMSPATVSRLGCLI